MSSGLPIEALRIDGTAQAIELLASPSGGMATSWRPPRS